MSLSAAGNGGSWIHGDHVVPGRTLRCGRNPSENPPNLSTYAPSGPLQTFLVHGTNEKVMTASVLLAGQTMVAEIAIHGIGAQGGGIIGLAMSRRAQTASNTFNARRELSSAKAFRDDFRNMRSCDHSGGPVRGFDSHATVRWMRRIAGHSPSSGGGLLPDLRIREVFRPRSTYAIAARRPTFPLDAFADSEGDNQAALAVDLQGLHLRAGHHP